MVQQPTQAADQLVPSLTEAAWFNSRPKPLISWFKDNDSYAPPADRDVKINKSVALCLSGCY